jgi:hypothetical protein
MQEEIKNRLNSGKLAVIQSEYFVFQFPMQKYKENI